MWSKMKTIVEEGYDYLVSIGCIKDVPKDDYMYEVWHNHCRHNPNSYHRNGRDDATVYINLAAIQTLVKSRDSWSIKRIGDLASEILR